MKNDFGVRKQELFIKCFIIVNFDGKIENEKKNGWLGKSTLSE